MADAEQSQEAAAISPPYKKLELPLFSLLVATRENALAVGKEAKAVTLEMSRFLATQREIKLSPERCQNKFVRLGPYGL